MNPILIPLFIIAVFTSTHLGGQIVSVPDKKIIPPDARATVIRHLDMPYTMPEYKTKEEWLARAKALREQILVSTGLWPMPPKCPLKAKIFGKIDHDDYTVEKVYFQTYPGFYLCGNLYRPKGKKGPFPGVLSPHGHWRTGRLEHQDLGSVPGRCIGLARRGCVVFAYDMVGYNDTNQIPHTFGGKREALWGISLMGLQLWNSIRAVDFLCSLPYVDKTRLGCTGASGGGTQTFMLCAVDERIAVSVPAVMISAHMQGGCLCENAPGLRIDTNNMEIAALMAPRPMLMIAATGDWTKNTATVEYPAIFSIYKLFGAAHKLAYVIFNAPHNYNQQSREAMYAWFNRWFFGITDPGQAKEAPFQPDQPRDLLVFYGASPPKGRIDAAGLTRFLIASADEKIESLKPKDKRGLQRFRQIMGVAYQRALAAEAPLAQDVTATPTGQTRVHWCTGKFKVEKLILGRTEKGDAIPALLFTPMDGHTPRPATLVLHPEGNKAFLTKPILVATLLHAGHLVLTIDAFATGDSPIPAPDPKLRYLDTYNRTETANRVQDILTALAYLRGRQDTQGINLVGLEKAGLWCLLAAALMPSINRVVADAAQFDTRKDENFVNDLYVPSLRRAGDFRTACVLAIPTMLFIHNTGGKFSCSWAAQVYRSLKIAPLLRVQNERADEAQIMAWLSKRE